MKVFVNGRFVPEEEAVVSVMDRSFLYGDGLFETLRVYGGRPFRLRQHLARLEEGAGFLRIKVPYLVREIERAGMELIERNGIREGVLRLTLSRGVGAGGYLPRKADCPVLVITAHPLEFMVLGEALRWRLVTSSLRVPANDPISRRKTCNKLHQILARIEADERGADEALILNAEGRLTEGTASNIFWIQGERVLTTPLESGILPGVTRAVVMELCRERGLECREESVGPEVLEGADGVFLTVSTLELVEAISLDGVELRRPALLPDIRHAYRSKVEAETGAQIK